MKFTDTLKKNYEFQRLYSKGKSVVTPHLVVYVRKTRKPCNRIGITVSTKLGKAHVRNRVRRRLREIYRLNEEAFIQGLEMVTVARVKAVKASYRQLEHSFMSACGKLGVLKEQSEG